MNLLTISFSLLLGMGLLPFLKQQALSPLPPQVREHGCDPICYVGERPACELTWAPHVSAVFLGTVSNFKEEKGAETVRVIATLTVDEAFLGIEGKSATVISGGDACGGLPFSIGRRYLIYAKRQDDGTLAVAACGGTKSADQASGDLKYLRSLSSAPSTGTLFGTAYRYKQPLSPHSKVKVIRQLHPLTGEKISIKSPSQAYETIVGPDGKFKAENLRPGNYAVDIDTIEPLLIEGSGGFTWRQNLSDGLILTIPAKGCAQVDFKIDPFHKQRR